MAKIKIDVYFAQWNEVAEEMRKNYLIIFIKMLLFMGKENMINLKKSFVLLKRNLQAKQG